MRSTTSSGLRFLSELAPILGAGDLRVSGPLCVLTLGGGFVLGTGKYPEEIVEKVAKAMAIYGDYDGCFERLEEWAAATDEQRELGEVEEPMDTDAEDAEWWRKRARAGLDALGLTMTEETAHRDRNGHVIVSYVADDGFDSRYWEPLHRTVLHAETPWEVVDR